MAYDKDFENYLLNERNLSHNTIYNYMRDLAQFFAYSSVGVTAVKPKHIKGFIKELKKKGMSVETTNRKLSSLKTFYKFLVNEGIMEFSPASTIEAGKKSQRLPKPVSLSDINTLMQTVDNLRDKTIFELLFSTGARRFEVIQIHKKNINFEDGYITLFGKGGKERTVPIHEGALRMMSLLFKQHKSEWLFPGRDGSHIAIRTVNAVFDKWIEKAGLQDKDITPHKFRHSFCSHLYANGADIKAIQDMAGHESSNTTQLYTKINNNRNRTEYNKLFGNR